MNVKKFCLTEFGVKFTERRSLANRRLGTTKCRLKCRSKCQVSGQCPDPRFTCASLIKTGETP
ncbi:hypothetical protein HAX54_028810, partial [Datura stramonium]|nr:hypothetical protein [Datura stramonium]